MPAGSVRPSTATWSVRRGLVALLAVAPLLGVVACTSGAEEQDPGAVGAGGQVMTITPVPDDTDAPAGGDARYAVFPDDVPAKGWTLAEAMRLTGEARAEQDAIDPGLDWFAEYEGPGENPNLRPFLSLSGYATSLADRRAEVSDVAEVMDGKIAGRDAYWGRDEPTDPETGTFVAVDFGDERTMVLTGVGVSLDDLRRVAATLRPATEAEWLAASSDAPKR